jgi:hypothetical protein
MASRYEEPSDTAPDEPIDTLVPDPQVLKEFSITIMSLWRWDRDPALDFPPPIKIRNKNYRSRRQLEQFKARMLRLAIEARGGKAA